MEHKDEGEEMTVRNFFQCTAKLFYYRIKGTQKSRPL